MFLNKLFRVYSSIYCKSCVGVAVTVGSDSEDDDNDEEEEEDDEECLKKLRQKVCMYMCVRKHELVVCMYCVCVYVSMYWYVYMYVCTVYVYT